MKQFVGLLVVGLLGAAVVGQDPLPGGPAPPSIGPQPSRQSPPGIKAAAILPGQSDFERETKAATEHYERAKLRYNEATERARLNYINLIEVSLGDLADGDPHAAKYQKELTRVRAMTFRSPKFEYKMYWWEHNAAPVKMIHKDEGFCYVANFGGAFNGGAEVARVYVGEDGYWYLHGSTGHGFLVVGAMAVKITH